MANLDALAGRYSCRPSGLLGCADGVKAITIDRWAFKWGAWHEEVERMKARTRGR